MRKVRKPALGVELLETREVPATATIYGSSLVVDGTNASESLIVRQDGSRITVDGTRIRVGSSSESYVDVSKISRVVVRASGGDDTINIATLKINAMVWGGSGNDRIYSGNGNDTIYGDQGNDTILGGSGNDWLVGGDGNDQIWGGAGNDWISGDNGADYLSGDSGDDSLSGGEGKDTLSGGSGADQFDGHGFGMGAADAERNFDTYRDEFDLWRPLNAREVPPLQKGELDNTGYLAALSSLSEADIKANIRVVARGVYDVTLPGDRRTIRVNFDGTWNDNDPKPTSSTNPSFALILLNRARLISYGIDPNRHFTNAEWDAQNARTGGRLYDPYNALRQFTGRVVSLIGPYSIDYSVLKNRIDNGAAAIVYSYRGTNRSVNSAGVVADTRYVVQRLFTDAYGRRWVELFNPMGTDRGDGRLMDNAPGATRQNDGIITLSWDSFRSWSNFTALYLA